MGSDDEEGDEKFTELQRHEDETIKLDGLKMNSKKEIRKLDDTGIFKRPNPSKKSSGKRDSESSSSSGEKRKVSALEEIMKEEEERKKKQVRLNRNKFFFLRVTLTLCKQKQVWSR